MQSAMKPRWPIVAVLLFCAVSTLTPLAYATPPDPTWIAGFWDDADHDDVILLITSDAGAVEPHMAPDGSPVHAVVTTVPQTDQRRACYHARSSPPPRAPPAS